MPEEHSGVATDSAPVPAETMLPPPDDPRLQESINNMNLRIKRLERAKAKLQERLQDREDSLKDARMEAEAMQAQLSRVEDATALLGIANQKVEKLTEKMRDLKDKVAKFRRWWLTEYHSLKVVSALLPNPDEVVEILSSSQDRFLSFSEDS